MDASWAEFVECFELSTGAADALLVRVAASPKHTGPHMQEHVIRVVLADDELLLRVMVDAFTKRESPPNRALSSHAVFAAPLAADVDFEIVRPAQRTSECHTAPVANLCRGCRMPS